mgnify:CR=1 FL=1
MTTAPATCCGSSNRRGRSRSSSFCSRPACRLPCGTPPGGLAATGSSRSSSTSRCSRLSPRLSICRCSYYTEYVREHAYGLSNQTFGKWFGDTLKSLAVACIVGALVMWVPYLLLRKSPRRWWLYTAIALVPFIVLANLVAPIWIASAVQQVRADAGQGARAEDSVARRPRRHRRQPRLSGEQERRHEDAQRLRRRPVRHRSASCCGTRSLKRMTDRELLFVMGHEMGHYVLHHVWQAIAFSVADHRGVFCTWRTGRRAPCIGPIWRRFGFTSLADVASLPLLLAVDVGLRPRGDAARAGASRGTSSTRPIASGWRSRKPTTAPARRSCKLQQDALANPRPGLLYKIFRESHPPLGERIDFANQYHPWTTGQPLEYGGKIQTMSHPVFDRPRRRGRRRGRDGVCRPRAGRRAERRSPQAAVGVRSRECRRTPRV